MTKKKDNDVVEIFSRLKKTLEIKPPLKRMYEEVRMMRFKIKPVSGDIFLLKLKNQQLIETLWGLGKLDEIFQKEYHRVPSNLQEAFFRMFDSLYQQFQDRLNKISINPEVKPHLPQILEMEIFKDKSAKRKSN